MTASSVAARTCTRPPEEAILRRHARERLAGFKIPAYWYSVGSLPHSAAGKLLRRELASWHEKPPLSSGASEHIVQ